MKIGSRWMATWATACGLAASPAFADDESSESFKVLSAQWWQWAMSIPVAANPLLDPKDSSSTEAVNCMVGQRGPVWFLAGGISSGTIRRSCTVPEGVALFFPVINTNFVDTPGHCFQTDSVGVPEMRRLAGAFIDAATGVEAKLDNRPVRTRRIRSDVFITALPADNLFLAACGGDLPAGIYSPSIDDGYYVKLDGLAPGVHTIEFRASSGAFALDVGYVLNVVPVAAAVRR